MDTTYRRCLIETIDYLTEVRSNIFTLALNLSLQCDLKEINDVFEVGDTFTFELCHLDNGSDINVQKLVSLIKDIQNTADSLININGIEQDELTTEI